MVEIVRGPRDKFPNEGMYPLTKVALGRLWNFFNGVDSFFGFEGFDKIAPLDADFSPYVGIERPPIPSLEHAESKTARAMQDATDELFRKLATITLTYREVNRRVNRARWIVDTGKDYIDSKYRQFFRFMEGQVILRKLSFFNPMIYGVSASDGVILAEISSTALEVENSLRRSTIGLGKLAREIDDITRYRVGPSKEVAAKRELFFDSFATTDGTRTGAVAGGLYEVVRKSVEDGRGIFFGEDHENTRIPVEVRRSLEYIAKQAGKRNRVLAVEFVYQTDQKVLDQFSADIRAAHNTSDGRVREQKLEAAR